MTPPPVVIKKIKKSTHSSGHHGGSWKIAYADFVTAMMAFFLLMWLLNATSEEQKRGIANFFDPLSLTSNSSGGNKGVMGGLSLQENTGNLDQSHSQEAPHSRPEELLSDTKNQNVRADQMGDAKGSQIPLEKPKSSSVSSSSPPQGSFFQTADEEKQALHEVADHLRLGIQALKNADALKQNILIEETEEGLKIHIMDQSDRAMFPLGSRQMSESMRAIVSQVAEAIVMVPNPIDISGHTDSLPYSAHAQRSNWDLSAERANETRRFLAQKGIPEGRFHSIVGKADRDPLHKASPEAPVNRRISILVLRQHP